MGFFGILEGYWGLLMIFEGIFEIKIDFQGIFVGFLGILENIGDF